MLPDPWLKRWLPLILERAEGRPVLELGCGFGADTATLLDAGLDVIGVELDPVSAEAARGKAPAATIVCQDIRQPFPCEGLLGVVVASLSLHYFSWDETFRLVARIRETLVEGGIFLCRLNSTEDRHFGAQGYPALEPNYYLVDGAPKRFFDEAALDRLFSDGWRVRAKEHYRTYKYIRPKALWEIVLERSAGPV